MIRFLVFIFLSALSFASGADTVARISKILMYEQGNLIYVYPEGGVQNPPACHGANGNYLSFKMTRPMAKEYLSLILTAFVGDKKVFFRTSGTCADQSVSETILWLTVEK